MIIMKNNTYERFGQEESSVETKKHTAIVDMENQSISKPGIMKNKTYGNFGRGKNYEKLENESQESVIIDVDEIQVVSTEIQVISNESQKISKSDDVMEDLILRFPNLAEDIFKKLAKEDLKNCSEVSRQWCNFIQNKQFPQKRNIQPLKITGENWKKVLKKTFLRIVQNICYNVCSPMGHILLSMIIVGCMILYAYGLYSFLISSYARIP